MCQFGEFYHMTFTLETSVTVMYLHNQKLLHNLIYGLSPLYSVICVAGIKLGMMDN